MSKGWLFLSLGIVTKITLASGHLITEAWQLAKPAPVMATCMSTQGQLDVAFGPGPAPFAAISKAISAARHSILVEAYSFTAKPIATALIAAKQRGVDVRIILDKSQVLDRYSAAAYFSQHGLPVRIAVKYAIFHNKVMIIDDNTVITGSFNYTKAAASKNAENVLIIHNNPALAKIYRQVWVDYWQQALPVTEFLVAPPSTKD